MYPVDDFSGRVEFKVVAVSSNVTSPYTASQVAETCGHVHYGYGRCDVPQLNVETETPVGIEDGAVVIISKTCILMIQMDLNLLALSFVLLPKMICIVYYELDNGHYVTVEAEDTHMLYLLRQQDQWVSVVEHRSGTFQFELVARSSESAVEVRIIWIDC